jgi:hypothetical protein
MSCQSNQIIISSSKPKLLGVHPNGQYYRVSKKNSSPTVGAFTTICKLIIVIQITRAKFHVHEVNNKPRYSIFGIWNPFIKMT